MEPKKRSRRQRIVGMLLFVIGIPSIIAAFLTFLPRLTVSPSDPVDPLNPFSASFTITNSNFVPLRHVNVYQALGEIAIGKPFEAVVNPNFEERGARFFNPNWRDHRLGMDERFTITLGDMYNCCKPGWPPINGAELGIIVEYTPWILPWKQEKAFAFVTHKQSNGQLYWYSIPDR
jgi:hypothetical protein